MAASLNANAQGFPSLEELRQSGETTFTDQEYNDFTESIQDLSQTLGQSQSSQGTPVTAIPDEVVMSSLLVDGVLSLQRQLSAIDADIEAATQISERDRLTEAKEVIINRLAELEGFTTELALDVARMRAQNLPNDFFPYGVIISVGGEFLGRTPLSWLPFVVGPKVSGGIGLFVRHEDQQNGVSSHRLVRTGAVVASVGSKLVSRMINQRGFEDSNNGFSSSGPFIEFRVLFARTRGARTLEDFRGSYTGSSLPLLGNMRLLGNWIGTPMVSGKWGNPFANQVREDYVTYPQDEPLPFYERVIPDIYSVNVTIGIGQQVERISPFTVEPVTWIDFFSHNNYNGH